MIALLKQYWPLIAAFALGLALMFVFKPSVDYGPQIKAANDRAKKAGARADSAIRVSAMRYRLYQADSASAAQQQARATNTAAEASRLRNLTHTPNVAKKAPAPVSDSAHAANVCALTEFLADKAPTGQGSR